MGSRSPAQRVRSVVADVYANRGESVPPVEAVDFRGYGVDFAVYVARLSDGPRRGVAVRIPRDDAPPGQPERARRAVSVQQRLRNAELPFAVPRPLGTCEVDAGIAVVEDAMPDEELADVSAGDAIDPVEITAAVAAGCHRIDPDGLEELVDGPATRRADAELAIEVFDELELPEFQSARTWCVEHLPETSPARFLHGDLLAQNILVDAGPNSDGRAPRISVVDWAGAQLGDPARELAQISRGYEKVFATGQTVEQLLAEYNRRIDGELSIEAVRLFELCGKAREVVEAGDRADQTTDQKAFEEFRRILERV